LSWRCRGLRRCAPDGPPNDRRGALHLFGVVRLTLCLSLRRN